MSGVYLLPKDSFDFIVYLLLPSRLSKEVHDYCVIIASNGIEVDIVFVFELLTHDVAEIRALGVNDQSVLLDYLFEMVVVNGNGFLLDLCFKNTPDAADIEVEEGLHYVAEFNTRTKFNRGAKVHPHHNLIQGINLLLSLYYHKHVVILLNRILYLFNHDIAQEHLVFV